MKEKIISSLLSDEDQMALLRLRKRFPPGEKCGLARILHEGF
jgi:hypothetical protein